MDGGQEIQSLPALQGAIKRQHQAYAADFRRQFAALESALEQFEAQPQIADSDMQELVMFCAHTSNFYRTLDERESMAQVLADRLIQLLRTHHEVARESHLKTFMSALILMDNRRYIDREKLYSAWLEFLSYESDLIPLIVMKQIIKTLSLGSNRHNNVAADKKLWQGRIVKMYGADSDSTTTALARRRLQYVMISLFLKGAWDDALTCNTIAKGVHDKCPKIVYNAARFLLGEVRKLAVSERNVAEMDLEDEQQRRRTAEMVASISQDLRGTSKGQKATGKALKNLEKLKETAARQLKGLEDRLGATDQLQQNVLRHIYDPHSFATALFARASNNSRLTYKTRLLLLRIVSRLIGKFEVYIPGFLNFMTKYIKPTQEKVTVVMAVVAEAVAEVIPEEELQATTRHIADLFAIESSAPEVVTVGLNTIREMCTRNKRAVTAELLDDLVRVGRESKHESVRIAAKSLRNFYRVADSSMLARRDRARSNEIAEVAAKAASEDTLIPGLDILVQLKALRDVKGKSISSTDLSSDAARQLQASRILSEKDFAALKKIRVKMMTAQAMGYSLKQWLDANEGAWEQLSRHLNGDTSMDLDALLGTPAGGDEEKEENEEELQLESGTSDEENSSEGDEEESIEDVADLLEEEEEGSDGEGSDSDAATQPSNGAPDHTMDEDSDSSGEESDAEHFLTPEKLRGRVPLSKERKRELTKATKIEMKQAMRDRRHGGKATNRAGISNRVQARSKPMAMLRQKRQNREKRVMSAKDKVAGLKAHVKTLKTAIKQKFRRR